MTRIRADLLLLLAAAIWGSAFYFQKSAMDHIGPLLFVGLRGFIAALALAPLAWAEGRRPGTGGVAIIRLGLVGGVAFFVAALLQQYGIKGTSVTNAGLLTALYVIITPLTLWIAGYRRPGALVTSGIVCAFAGSWLLGGATAGGFTLADWAVIAATLFWTAHLIVTDRAARIDRPFGYTAIQFAVVSALALPLALLFEPVAGANVLAAWDSLLFVGLLSSALTFTLLAIALRHAPAMEGVLLMSTETLFSVMAGYWLLGERLSPLGWLGAAMIVGAVLLVQVGRARRARPADQAATIT